MSALVLICWAACYGQCLDADLKDRVIDVLRWATFWHEYPGGATFSGDVTVVRSTVETTALLHSIPLMIAFPQERDASEAPVYLFYKFSKDKAENVDAYLRILTGNLDFELVTGDGKKLNVPRRENDSKPRPHVISQCDASLLNVRLLPPASQTVMKIPPAFLDAARAYANKLVETRDFESHKRIARCPCRVWFAYASPTDPQGFGILEQRDHTRDILGYYWDGKSSTFASADSPFHGTVDPREERKFYARILAHAKFTAVLR